jgi:hypothetical protein
MTVRQRPNADTAGSAQTPLIPSNQYPEQTAKPTPLPWYRYPLNLFIARSIRYLGLIGFWHHARKYNYEPKSIPYSRKKSIRARDGYEIVLTIYDPSSSPARGTLKLCALAESFLMYRYKVSRRRPHMRGQFPRGRIRDWFINR